MSRCYLVPEDVVDSWRGKSRLEQIRQPETTDLIKKDAGLSEALRGATDSKESDYERYKIMEQRLGQFLNARQIDASEQNPPLASSPRPSPMPDYSALQSLPKTFRSKAEMLLREWGKDPGIAWDERHRVTVDGKPVSGSNIIDLAGDAIRQRKLARRPHGFHILRERTKQLNLPRTLVSNPAWADTDDSEDVSSGDATVRDLESDERWALLSKRFSNPIPPTTPKPSTAPPPGAPKKPQKRRRIPVEEVKWTPLPSDDEDKKEEEEEEGGGSDWSAVYFTP